jgi:hypothetical protein
MSLAYPSPLCTVNAASTINGVDVTAGSTVTIALVDTAGVKQWNISSVSTDDLLAASTITAGLTIDSVAKTATFTAPAAGSAILFQSVVNAGKDANGAADTTLTTRFGVFVKTTSGFRTSAFGQTTEGNAAFGWTADLNQLARNTLVTPASAGTGMTYSAGAYNVNANADGSIVVSADDVKVGVLATDAQHGTRGGGTQHAASTTSVNGFMSAADKTKLDAATSSPTASTLALRGVGGAISFGMVSCTGIDGSGNSAVAGTFSVGGASTLHAVSCTSVANSGNSTIGGTLTASGATTCAALSCTTLTASGATTCAALSCTTLGVSGATTCAALSCTTLGVSGATTCAALTTSGLTVSGNAAIGAVLTCTGSILAQDLTLATTLSVAGAATLSGATTSGDFTMTSTTKVKLASRSIGPRTIAATPILITSNWTYDIYGRPVTSSTAQGTISFDLALPDGAVLNTVSVYFKGAAGHGGAPASLPQVALNEIVQSTGVATNKASATGTYGSAGAYEAIHAITMSAINYTVVRNGKRICVLVTSESGANTVAGFQVQGCDVTFTVTSMDDGKVN